jgi:uncharacterized protein
MKFLLVLLVIVVVLGLMSARRRGLHGSHRRSSKARAPEPMVACARCGVHLPRADATQGVDGRWFCSAAHAQSSQREKAR